MAIKAFISRQIKHEHLKQAYQLVTRARYEAMKHKGYISSETLTEIDSPETILVVSMWKSIEEWNAWRNSAARGEIESEFEKLSVRPTEYATFALGVQIPE